MICLENDNFDFIDLLLAKGLSKFKKPKFNILD